MTYKEIWQLAQDKGMIKPKVYLDNELYCMVYVQKWLRHTQNMNIDVVVSDFPYDYFKILYSVKIWFVSKENDYTEPEFFGFETYEKALLQGIAEALKLI